MSVCIPNFLSYTALDPNLSSDRLAPIRIISTPAVFPAPDPLPSIVGVVIAVVILCVPRWWSVVM